MLRDDILTELVLRLTAEERYELKPTEKAAKEGNLESVKKYITYGGDVNNNFNSMNKYTLLHHASNYGHIHVVEYLLTCPNINLMAVDEDGATALHLAALNAHPEIVKILCEATQNKGVNSITLYGSTPLHMAIDRTNDPNEISRSHVVMDYLLHIPEINLHIRDNRGKTPLILAKNYYRPDLAKKIIKAAITKAELYLRDMHGFTIDSETVVVRFGNHVGVSKQFWKEVVIPTLTTVFNDNNYSAYRVTRQKRISYGYDGRGFEYVAYLKHKGEWHDGMYYGFYEDLHSASIQIAIHLAENTDIKIKNFCKNNLEGDVYPYQEYDVHAHKLYRERTAFQAYLIPVLISFCRQNHILSKELWLQIFSYCNKSVNNYEKTSKAFNTVLQTLINTDNGSSLVKFYSSVGGSNFRVGQLSFFSRTSSEKIEKFKEWEALNHDGASSKTLSHYFLK